MEPLSFILAFLATILVSILFIVAFIVALISKSIHSGLTFVVDLLTKALRFTTGRLKRQ